MFSNLARVGYLSRKFSCLNYVLNLKSGFSFLKESISYLPTLFGDLHFCSKYNVINVQVTVGARAHKHQNESQELKRLHFQKLTSKGPMYMVWSPSISSENVGNPLISIASDKLSFRLVFFFLQMNF